MGAEHSGLYVMFVAPPSLKFLDPLLLTKEIYQVGSRARARSKGHVTLPYNINGLRPPPPRFIFIHHSLFQGALFPAHRKQDLAAMKEILPQLIGKDPRETNRICDLMDLIAPYLNYAKSPIDIACWDILAKVQLYQLLAYPAILVGKGKTHESSETTHGDHPFIIINLQQPRPLSILSRYPLRTIHLAAILFVYKDSNFNLSFVIIIFLVMQCAFIQIAGRKSSRIISHVCLCLAG